MTMTADPVATIDAPSVRLMTADEARACVAQIRAGLENVRLLLLDLHEREGWRALGYDSWRACAAAEFSLTQSRAYQLLDAAKVDRILSTFVENGPMPETHARELAPLKDDPDAVRQVYAEVRDAAGGRPTQRDVRAGVDRLLSRPARPAPKPSAATKRVAEPDLSQDIPDDLALAGADVDPAHEFPFNNEPAVAPKAEQWCQTCGGKYRGAACPCAATVEVEPSAAATAPAEEARPEPSARRDDWRPVRSAISDPTPARRTGVDGGSVIYVDATAGAITRALFSHGGGIAAIVDAIAEEAPQEQFVALVGLMSERLPIEQAKALYRRLDTRIRVHNDKQTAMHLTGKAS